MISPQVAMIDLESEGLGRLNQMMSKRLWRSRHELHVLHRSGEVINVVDTKQGHIDGHRERIVDPAARAEELLAISGAERVILVDHDRAEELSASLVQLAASATSQTNLLWLAEEAIFEHPAIAVAPTPRPSIWEHISRNAAELGDDYWAVLGAWDGEELALSLIARVEQGLITVLTSADHFHIRPARSDGMQLIDAVEARGPVKAALLCDISLLDDLFADEDPTAFAATLAERSSLYRRGLDVLGRRT